MLRARDKRLMTQIFMVLGIVCLIPGMVMFRMPVRKSQETGKLTNPKTGKVYSYNPKQTAWILLSLAVASLVAVFALASNTLFPGAF